METILRQGLAALGLPQDAVPHLIQFSDRLLETNKVMNLTAITEPEEVARLHFLDSAALLLLADFRGRAWWMSAPGRASRGCRCGSWSPASA